MRRRLSMIGRVWGEDHPLEVMAKVASFGLGVGIAAVYSNALIGALSGPVWLWITALSGFAVCYLALIWLEYQFFKILACLLILGLRIFRRRKPAMDGIWEQSKPIKLWTIEISLIVWIVATFAISFSWIYKNPRLSLLGLGLYLGTLTGSTVIAFGFGLILRYLLCGLQAKKNKKV